MNCPIARRFCDCGRFSESSGRRVPSLGISLSASGAAAAVDFTWKQNRLKSFATGPAQARQGRGRRARRTHSPAAPAEPARRTPGGRAGALRFLGRWVGDCEPVAALVALGHLRLAGELGQVRRLRGRPPGRLPRLARREWLYYWRRPDGARTAKPCGSLGLPCTHFWHHTWKTLLWLSFLWGYEISPKKEIWSRYK